MKPILFLFSFLVASCFIQAQTSGKMKLSDYLGINTNVAAYDNKYLADLSKCVKWIREYHDWSHYEAANNYYKWDNITTQPQGYNWPDHNLFMNECRKYGINVLIDVLGKPSWVGTLPIPASTGTGANAADYLERLEFMGQLVARYGSKKIDKSLLETVDKATGLNIVKYFEDDNEPDYTWKSPLWSAASYSKYCNAVHDGFGVQTSAEYPLLGIKSVDPDAKHVMAGLASSDTVYVNEVLKASGGRIPFDVLNVHHYCTDMTNGYSPENEKYGYEVKYRDYFRWKKRVLPNLPVWMTEFGWDTYLAPDNKHSYIYATAQQQANYILRSYLVLLKMGFEKAFLFMDTDGNSKNTLQYSSSGLLTDKASKYAKKKSYYYLATMQNVLGNYEYTGTMLYKQPSGVNEIYCLEFTHPQNSAKVYALWTRRTGSNNDLLAQTNYQFSPGYLLKSAYSVLPADLDMDGDTIIPKISDTKIELKLTETPQFVFVSERSTFSNQQSSGEIELNVFPNPANSQIQVALSNPEKQQVHLSVWSVDGKLVKTLVNGLVDEGRHTYSVESDLLPGAYFVKAMNDDKNTVKKVICVN